MIELHAKIMNIQACDPGLEADPQIAYKMGHRDARHAAAELAIEAGAAMRSGGAMTTIDSVMTAVWALVRSGPNFDGRDSDVRSAVAAAIAEQALVWRDEVAALRADAARLDWLQSVSRCDPKMDGQHVWWPLSWNTCQACKGNTIRDGIDAAILAGEPASPTYTNAGNGQLANPAGTVQVEFAPAWPGEPAAQQTNPKGE